MKYSLLIAALGFVTLWGVASGEGDKLLMVAALALLTEWAVCWAFAFGQRRTPFWTIFFSGIAASCLLVAYHYQDLNTRDSDGAIPGLLILWLLRLHEGNMSPMIPMIFLIWLIPALLAARLAWIPKLKQNA